MESIAAVLVLAILVSAAVSDWRIREASDLHWVAIGAIGAILFAVRLIDAGTDPMAYASVVSMVLMMADLVWDRESGRMDLALYTAIAAAVIVSLFALMGSDLLWIYISMPAMYTVMNLFYYTGIVKGGADAKAVISIAFAFPAYPAVWDLPLIAVPSGDIPQFMVPAFSVFFLAAVLTILMAAVYLIINLIRGDREFPFMFAGYRMDLSAMAGAHVWPMEDVVDGERIRSLSGLEDPGIPERLAEAGMDRVWVTPIIPFLIPIAISFALIIIVGNPLFAFT
jgi:preflagellin peptidase FlaK